MADEERKISISLDQQAAQAALKSIKSLQDAQKDLAASALQSGKAYDVVAKELRDLQKAERDAQAVLKVLDRDFEASGQSARDAASGIAEYEEKLRSVQAGGADLSGDIAGAIGGIRGASSAVGLGAVSDVPLGIAEAFADFGEFVPRLRVGLEAAAKSGTGLASTASSLALSVLPAAGASFGAIAATLAPIVAIGAAVAAAFAFVSSELDKASQAAARQADAQIEANRAVNALIVSGATTGEALAVLTTQYADDVEETLRNAQSAQEEYADYLERRGNNIFQAIGDGLNLFGNEEQRLADEAARTEQEFVSATTAYNELNSSVQGGEFAANDLAAQERELAETREREAEEAIRLAEEAEREATLRAARVAQLEQQRSDLIANRAIQEANAAETAALEAEFAREDEKAEDIAHQQELIDIRKQGNARVQELEAKLTELPLELQKSISEAQAKGNEQLGKLQSDYFE
jgi:hypothetical protein